MKHQKIIRSVAMGALSTIFLSAPLPLSSQNNGGVSSLLNQSYDDFLKQSREGYKTFRDSVKKDYQAFRDSINKEYADFMRKEWTLTKVDKEIDAPANIEPEPDIEPLEVSDLPVTNPQKVKVEQVVDIKWPTPQPVPFGEIKDMPGDKRYENIKLWFYGTPLNLRGVDLSDFVLNGNDEKAFADGWERLSQYSTNNLINDCLNAREELNLPDWGYIKMLDNVSAKLKGADTNEQRLLQGFLLNQTGYKVRFCYDSQKNLHVLFASSGLMFSKPRYRLNNISYYSYTEPKGREVRICNFETPGEKAVDFGINRSLNLAYRPYLTREIDVERHPDLTLKLTPNRNLIDFLNDYPATTVDSSPYSMWAIHGNTPVSKEVREQLYPSLRAATEGMSEYNALQLLLKVAQSFPYGYDDEIWGHDRAFWLEESWAYPKSDCEDHAINFSHMVRDILGLDVCLIYYPGHLSSCVSLTDPTVPGDYLSYNGKKYIVCDPTYFFSNAGKTAPSNVNSEVVLIPLRKLTYEN